METKEKSKGRSGRWKKLLSLAASLAAGAICGIIIAEMAFGKSAMKEESFGSFLLFCLTGLILIYLAAVLQIILHEAGHLIFGLMTGYQFSSFRIGSFMWLKENGRLRFCRLSLVGTGGQCLMAPPDMKDGELPYMLYNLGGSIMNLMVGAAAGLLYLRFRDAVYLSLFFAALLTAGIAFAALNGIPMQMGNINNDGYNAWSLGKDREALQAFWIQMKINEQISKGIRLKDMPDEWFDMPSEAAIKNSMSAAIGVFVCNRLMDSMKLEEAAQTMKKLMNMDTGMVGLHRSLLQLDCIYCELTGENRPEQLEKMMDKNMIRFMKSMKKFPGILRTGYAYALLAEHNREKAVQIEIQFNKAAKRYPHPCEIEGERELMEYARQKADIDQFE